jgi:hypothetical protein
MSGGLMVVSKISFLHSCAAMDLAEIPSPFFDFFEFRHIGKEIKESNRPAGSFLSDALRCSEVRKEIKEILFSLFSRETPGRKPENSRFWFRRLSGGKT